MRRSTFSALMLGLGAFSLPQTTGGRSSTGAKERRFLYPNGHVYVSRNGNAPNRLTMKKPACSYGFRGRPRILR